MIDFLLGIILGAIAAMTTLHFTGRLSAKTETDLSRIEIRIQAMSQAGDELVQKITAAAAQVGAALEAKAASAVAAEKADHETDLTNIGGAVDQLQAAIPAPE